jgi:hypothetical protein
MNKTLSLFFLLLFSIKGISQTEFAAVGTTWEYTIYSGLSDSESWVLLESLKDTFVSGRNCKKISSLSIHKYRYPIAKIDGPFFNDNAYLLNIQNDSLFVFEFNEFKFQYKIRYQIGDSITHKYGKYLLTQIDTITLNSGQKIRRYKFDMICNFNSNSYFYMLENIGVDGYGIFRINSACLVDGLGYFLCYYTNKEISYVKSSDCKKRFTVNNHDFLLNTAIFISPSTTSQYLSIKTDYVFKHINIVDLNGKILKSTPYTEGVSLDVSYLPNGLYILQLIDNQGKRAVKKFVKM